MNTMTSNKSRFILVGGFLGSGKTTAISRLARHYHSQGLKVGIITNDQADDLVDTGFLRSEGYNVEEIAGSCFCCNFNGMAEAAARLSVENHPDIILAEPVGSCTDIVATVVQPLRDLFRKYYTVAPFSVLVDPVRARQVFVDRSLGGFSTKVVYIFQKQIEESDVIVLSKTDTLNSGDLDELLDAIRRACPGRTLLPVSSMTGENLDAWLEEIAREGSYGRRIAEVDYNTYAEGEAELGWLNATCELSAVEPFDVDVFLMGLMKPLADRFAQSGKEPAHLKTLFEHAGRTAVANLTSSAGRPVLSRSAGGPLSAGKLTVNARVHMEPEDLTRIVEEALGEVAEDFGIRAELQTLRCFKPGRPVPTHRYAQPVE